MAPSTPGWCSPCSSWSAGPPRRSSAITEPTARLIDRSAVHITEFDPAPSAPLRGGARSPLDPPKDRGHFNRASASGAAAKDRGHFNRASASGAVAAVLGDLE